MIIAQNLHEQWAKKQEQFIVAEQVLNTQYKTPSWREEYYNTGSEENCCKVKH